MRVVHMTSAHAWNDVRIYGKMCRSLAKAGHEVHIIAPADKPSGVKEADGVFIHSVTRALSRLKRMTCTVRNVALDSIKLKADLYHLHDPELMTVANKIKTGTGAAVILDMHEDVPVHILSKSWIPTAIRSSVAKAYNLYEQLALKNVDGIIAATPKIAERYSSGMPCAVVKNYPLLEEFGAARCRREGLPYFVYTGRIAEERGIIPMVDAIGELAGRARLAIAGSWSGDELRRRVMMRQGWKYVRDYGYLGRDDIVDLMRSAAAGIVILKPLPNYIESMPIKLFEYMAAGMPVIVSDFPLWNEIIGNNGKCGFLVNPVDVHEVVRTMNMILDDEARADAMGRNGRELIESRYNWTYEFQKFELFYSNIMKMRDVRI